METLDLWIPAMKNKYFEVINPVPKQSVRFGVTRYRTTGTHQDAFTGSTVHHQKGDVVIYRNKKTGLRDVITVAYQKPEVEAWEKYIRNIVMPQLPRGFKMWEGEVIVEKLVFIFKPLKGFTKGKIKLINEGQLIPKTTRPDVTDNLPKGFFDAIEGLIFKNDSQISTVKEMTKCYGKNPGVLLVISGK